MLRILYQDEKLVVVDKPAGLLVHRTGLDAGETQFALQMLRDQLGRPVWPAHRLDKGTSGALLFALDADTARTLAQAFEVPDLVRKTYRAVVRGWPADAGVGDPPPQQI
jgi:tRNA pseudouridine65 synthase